MVDFNFIEVNIIPQLTRITSIMDEYAELANIIAFLIHSHKLWKIDFFLLI